MLANQLPTTTQPNQPTPSSPAFTPDSALKLGEQLGHGTFGQVVRATAVTTKSREETFALKILDRRSMSKQHEKLLFSERDVMELVDSPFTVKLINT